MWQPLERAAVVEQMRFYRTQYVGDAPAEKTLYAVIAQKLRAERPETFES
jgi:hypothetical protein